MNVIGEDAVTKAIIKKLINQYRPDITTGIELPVRGSDIKRQSIIANNLNEPVFILTDQDQHHCPPFMIRDWFGPTGVNNFVNFRIATTEAESWLMADRSAFAKWLKIDVADIPEAAPISRTKQYKELTFPLKPSLFLMRELASKSRNPDLREQLMPKELARKGPYYNSALLPFIEKKWRPQTARNNSTSLEKAIRRLIDYKYP